jgi:hypothetical protein
MYPHPATSVYEERLRQIETALGETRRRRGISGLALAVAAAIILITGSQARSKRVPAWLPLLPAALAAVAGRELMRTFTAESRGWRLRRSCERALRRAGGEWAGQDSTGAEFAVGSHPFARDLNVVGGNSLFEFLCVARTAVGRRGLSRYLLETPNVEETLARQRAVAELKPRADLRERLAALGEFEFSDAKWETFTEWLEAAPIAFWPGLRQAAMATSALLAGIALAAYAHAIPRETAAWCAAPLLAIQAAAGLAFRDRINEALGRLGPAATEIGLLREGIELAASQTFDCAKLQALAAPLREAVVPIRRLERLLGLVAQRTNDWFRLPGLLLMAGTQLCIAIERWRAQRGGQMSAWLDAWAEFEALNCFASYAFENPDHVFPEFTSGEPRLEAKDLGHPLIADAECVRNDIQLGPGARFYVISGSNMSGKSTLLRAIGLNVALAQAGAPVRARSMRLSTLAPCAAISLVDSLESGRSKFLVEVERLKQIIEISRGERPALFLIDEIFAGTNSNDRRVAAEAVVRALVKAGAIGALSTHDLALTEIAGQDGFQGVNVHTGSREGGGPLDFDYLMKPGITRESNALAIARMAGVEA